LKRPPGQANLPPVFAQLAGVEINVVSVKSKLALRR
jgi:hypothetical protein